jgi:putative transcription antitermination factor YqgF
MSRLLVPSVFAQQVFANARSPLALSMPTAVRASVSTHVLTHSPNIWPKILGLDVSPSVVGLAVTDPSLTVVKPLTTLPRHRTDFAKLLSRIDALAAENSALAGLVVGWPRELDGSEGEACQRVWRFAKQLVEHASMPVTLWDEAFSTMRAATDRHAFVNQRASACLKSAKPPRAPRGRLGGDLDAGAAAHILNDFLRYFEERANDLEPAPGVDRDGR